jgi:peptidoglycan/LPS O-acetylase OafA/YrhL
MAAGMQEQRGGQQDAGEGREVLQAGERRLARVESLRAVAALGVALGHAWGLSHDYTRELTHGTYIARIMLGGGFGVFLFFALSGYLLFWPFARRHFGGGAPIDLGRYAMNRAVRILPLYFFAVIVLLTLQEHGGTAEQWWRFMLLAENFSLDTVGKVDGALWSLVVEVHFYILLPLIAAATAALARGSRLRAAIFLLGLGAISFALRTIFVAWADPPSPLWRYNFPTTFFFFVPGMALALLRLELEERRPRWLAGPLGASGPWFLASAVVWFAIFYRYSLSSLAALASFLMLGACVLPLRESIARRLLDWRPLAAIGVVSYSLYVWHSRVQVHLVGIDGFPQDPAAVILLTLPASVAVAFISYRVVEAPFLRLRRRWSTASAPIVKEPAADPVPSPAG